MQFTGHLFPVHQSMSVSWAFTLSHFVSQIRLRDFSRLLAIGMCHFLPVHHFGMACLAGSKVNIQPLVDSDQKAPFSIATTPRCRGGRYSCRPTPPYQLPLSLMAIRSDRLVVFLISDPGHYRYAKHNLEGGDGLLQAQERGSLCDTFVQLSIHLQTISGE